MFETNIQIVGATLTFAVTVLVCLWGGAPERIAAIASAVGYLVSPWVQNQKDYVSPQWGVAGVDIALLVVLTTLVVRYDRWWLIAAWGCVVLTVMAHVGKMLDVSLLARGYIGSLYILYFVFLTVLAFGVLELRIRGLKGAHSGSIS